MRVFSAFMLIIIITQVNAQNTPTFLKTDNHYIQQRIEKSDPEGWLYFKPSAGLVEGDLFQLHKTALGLSVNDSMYLVESIKDDQGYTHNRYQQYYKHIKVENAEFFEHVKDCTVELIHGKNVEQLNLTVVPAFTQEQALNAALAFLDASLYAWENSSWEQGLKDDTGNANATYYPNGELVLTYPFGVNMAAMNYKLAWKFEILALSPKLQKTVYVNANTGDIIKSFEMEESNGPAVTLYDGIQTIDTKWFGGLFHGHHHLESDDAGKKIKTRNGSSVTFDQMLNPIPNPWSSLDHIFDSDDVWAADQSNNTSAHWGVNRAWDYFKTTFGRSGMNNANGEIRIFAGSGRFGASFFNSGGKDHLEFGSSGSFNGNANFATLDVCGHEFTHGIVRNEANFDRSGEQGALNESFADIFGTLVENFQRGGAINWTIGEDAAMIRDLQNPHAFSHPETYLTDPFWVPVPGCIPLPGGFPFGNNLCGIHTNCGVQNKWFYLLTQGGVQNGVTVQGIGSSSAARITYSNLCNFLGSASGYPDARLGSIAAARQIFGPCSNEEIQTTNAWAAVGVGTPFSGSCLTVYGRTFICIEEPTGYPTYTAHDLPGASFSWNFPSDWAAYTTGSGNRTLVVTQIPNYSSYPTSIMITATSSFGGTSTIEVTLYNCGSEGIQICKEDESTNDRVQSRNTAIIFSSEVTLSPNPAKSQMLVRSNEGHNIEKIEIYKLDGTVLFNYKSISKPMVPIDVSNLSAGVYIVKVQLDKQIITKRFIKID